MTLTELLATLRSKGKVEIIETSTDTAHLTFEGHDVSIFVLPKLAKYVDGQTLTIDGILATKLHAILDRGTRRDFFDLYVVLSEEHLGIVECLRALREVNRGEDINEGAPRLRDALARRGTAAARRTASSPAAPSRDGPDDRRAM